MAKLYGWGASIVIVGALFKIQHWPFASEFLIIGLGTEAVIFFFSAFEPLHEEVDWSLVYPELAVGSDEDEELEELEEETAAPELDSNLSVTEQLDNMLEEAKIGPELIESLGTGLRSLTEQTGALNDLADASMATNDYVDSMRSASNEVNKLSETYSEASSALSSITISAEDGQAYSSEMQKISTNLAELNSVYELQLKGSAEQLESTNKLYDGIGQLMGNLHDSIEDTRKYKENIAELSKNLDSLNTVYGNMLNAMQGNPQA